MQLIIARIHQAIPTTLTAPPPPAPMPTRHTTPTATAVHPTHPAARPAPRLTPRLTPRLIQPRLSHLTGQGIATVLRTLATALATTLAAATFATATTPDTAPASAPATSGVQQFMLDNGMELLVLPDHRAPTAVHMVWLRVGSMDEVDGTSGVAHVLEHMMFKGSATLGPGEFSRHVARLGGRDNAFTSLDYTGYFQQVPADRLRDVMALEADRFATNQWADEEFTREIAVVKEERRLRTEDNPRAMLLEQLAATMFTASPYRRPIIGWMNDLDAMTPQDARDFYRQWYTPANAVIVVVGDVNAQQVLAWAQDTYGRIPAQAVPDRKPRQEPPQLGLRRITVKQPAQQAYVALAWHAPSLRNLQQPGPQDRDAMALLVLSAILDGYPGARLDRALVQGEAASPRSTTAPARVADSASSNASVMGRGPGTFMLTGIPAQGRTAAELETALRAQITRIAQEGVQPAELQRVKNQWMAAQVYERDSMMGQAFNLGTQWILGLPPDAEDRLLAHLMAITPEHIQAVAAKYFGDDTLNIATLDPQPRPPGQPARRPALPLTGRGLH